MSGALRRPVIAGNWKMYKTPEDALRFFDAFTTGFASRTDRTVVFFPPSIALQSAAQALRARNDIAIGVQNIHWEKEGAFTGEVSAPMAAAAGARFALCGHSERRHVFGETDEQVGRKAAAAVEAGLVPVICVGETLEERRADHLEEVLERQLAAALERVLPGVSLAVAYEPVWAIGTGVNATPADAAAAHAFLRDRLRERLGDGATDVPILYGGSVKPENAAALLAAEAVDGLLVGGASLDPESFARIASA
jgi:triosephosphate isomerase